MIKCPNCSASHYTTSYSTSTALGWVQEYEDGIPVNSNPNQITTYCTCCECHHRFHFIEQYGEVTQIIDDGLEPEVPTLEFPINITPHTTMDINYSLAPTFKGSNEIEIPYKINFSKPELEKEIEEIKQSIKELKVIIEDVRRAV